MKRDDLAKTVYYTDVENDEFSGISPKGFFIPADYRYIHDNVFYRFFAFVSYRLILTPIAFFHRVFGLHQRFENRKILKAFKHKGYFIFGNHTNLLGGGFTPSLICFPKRLHHCEFGQRGGQRAFHPLQNGGSASASFDFGGHAQFHGSHKKTLFSGFRDLRLS
jgi:hypothetical protein